MRHLLIKAALTVVLSALAAAAILAHQTAPLDHIPVVLAAKEQPLRDLPNMIEQTAVRQGTPLVLTESLLNDYLARRIAGHMHGLTGHVADFDRVLVRFQDGKASVYLVWRVALGHQITARVDFSIQRSEDHFAIEVLGGAYGRLEVPRALLPPLLPALEAVAQGCKQELDTMFRIPHIQISAGRLVLNPKF